MNQRKPLSLSGDGYSLDEANCYDVIAIHIKLLEAFSFIEKKLNLNLHIDQIMVATPESILIVGVDVYYFDNFIWDSSRGKGHAKIMEFRCSSFGFTLPNALSSTLSITFDCYFNILSVEFKSTSTHNSVRSKIELTFDHNLEPSSIYFHPFCDDTSGAYGWLKTKKTLCSLSEELLFFQISQSKNDAVKDLLPEFYIPSAYDFKSEYLMDRLKLFEILKY